MTFGQSSGLWLLGVVLVIVLLVLRAFRWRVQALGRFGNPDLMAALAASASAPRWWTKALLVLLGLLLLAVAISRPQLGTEPQLQERRGMDLILVLDTSLSMAAQDVAPDRLAQGKELLETLLDRMQGGRVGLIIFAGDAALRFPLTTDMDAARVLLRSTTVGMSPLPGSDVGRAIHLAGESLIPSQERKEETGGRAIVLVTDGEDHGDRTLLDTRETVPGVPIYILGVGTPEGGLIPLQEGLGRPQGYKRDDRGQLVVTRLEEDLLREWAEKSGGRYLRSTGGQGAVLQLWADLRREESTQVQSAALTQPQEKYQIFALLALLVLALEIRLSERRSERP